MSIVNAKISLTLGRLIKNIVINQIKKYCDYNDITYEIQEYKGFFESDYLIKLKGDEDLIKTLERQIYKLAKM
jgi:hypothetical protein